MGHNIGVRTAGKLYLFVKSNYIKRMPTCLLRFAEQVLLTAKTNLMV